MGELKDDIQKYLEGTLTPLEMHALEKKALGDPFLADALEGGASMTSGEFKDDVNSINKKLSKKGVEKNPWGFTLRIAASIALLCGTFYFVYVLLQPKDHLTESAEELDVSKDSSPGSTLPKADELATKDAEKNLAQNTEKIVPPTASKSTGPKRQLSPSPSDLKSGEEQVSAGPTALSKAANTEAEIVPQKTKESAAKADANAAPAPAFAGNSSGADDTADRRKEKDGELSRSSVANTDQTVLGKITSAHNGEPIRGASVLLQGTTERTITDVNGNFELKTQHGLDNIIILSPGYQAQEITVPKGQSNIYAQLFLDSISGVSEMVIVDHQDKRKATILLAEPVVGNKGYSKYLDTHVRYPAEAKEKKIQGKSTVEFTIHPDGTLTGFKVMDGLGYGCDEEMIRLIKDGPAWKPSIQEGKPINSIVRVQVEFKLPDK